MAIASRTWLGSLPEVVHADPFEIATMSFSPSIVASESMPGNEQFRIQGRRRDGSPLLVT